MEVGDAEVDVHETFLGELCRVCGDKLQKAKSRSTSFVCNTHQADLKSGFSIDVERDDITQHPPHFCMSCYKKMKRICHSKETTTPYRATVNPFQWTPHTSEGCSVSTDML